MYALFFRPVDAQSGDFITETWFMALLISMVSVMVILFGAMLFVRRRQMLSKKTMTPSRSNGRVLSTPLASKHEAPLWLDKDALPEYASTLPEYSKLNPHEYRDYINASPQSNSMNHNSVNLHNNPMHPNEYSRPNDLEYSSDKSYAMRNSQNAEYAEVDSTLIQQDNNSGACSPAPYATTTLVTGGRKFGNSMVSLLLIKLRQDILQAFSELEFLAF